MQKVINVLAILSFLGLSSILATSGYVYWRRDAIAEQVTENITQAATEAIADVRPGISMIGTPISTVTGGAEGSLGGVVIQLGTFISRTSTFRISRISAIKEVSFQGQILLYLNPQERHHP